MRRCLRRAAGLRSRFSRTLPGGPAELPHARVPLASRSTAASVVRRRSVRTAANDVAGASRPRRILRGLERHPRHEPGRGWFALGPHRPDRQEEERARDRPDRERPCVQSATPALCHPELRFPCFGCSCLPWTPSAREWPHRRAAAMEARRCPDERRSDPAESHRSEAIQVGENFSAPAARCPDSCAPTPDPPTARHAHQARR